MTKGPVPIRQFRVLGQPDATTCGPTCLHALYRYYDDDIPLDRVVSEVTELPSGGTLAVWLACHALGRGYDATIYTYNVQFFDPTWFAAGMPTLIERLRVQCAAKPDPKLALVTQAYLEFFERGGIVKFEDLTPELLRGYLERGVPLLTGLSATFLYGCARERDDEYDDGGGEPAGHFVVLSAYDRASTEVMVADPLRDNPRADSQYYHVSMMRLICAILLGIVTYDANVLVITPRTR